MSRRDGVDLYAHGLLERTRERCPIEELQSLRSRSGKDGDDTEVAAVDGGEVAEDEAGDEYENDEDRLDAKHDVKGAGRIHCLSVRQQRVGNCVVDFVIVGRNRAVNVAVESKKGG